ncbi:hypothetical protein TNCV_2661921 [Trichonephila clavipes]|nr:hypothetical protein TNCV_2661921 [Trichonephila clavipes]
MLHNGRNSRIFPRDSDDDISKLSSTDDNDFFIIPPDPDEMTDEEYFDENLIDVFLEILSKDLLKHIVKDSIKYPKQKNRFSLMRIPEEIQTDICVPTVLNAGISSAI